MAATPDGGALVVGIDAGGTSVRALVARRERLVARRDEPLAPRGEARGAAQADGGPGALDALLADVPAVGVAAVCAGIAKFSRAGVREAWEADLARRFPEARICVVPDFVIAFHGATGGVGIAVVAGTGSVVYGEDGRGGAARVGGRGWEYGDEGSAAWLTAEMVRRTLRARDGLAPSTPLTDAVCAYLGGARDAGELAESARRQAMGEAGRGFLAPLAAERAHDGDPEARNLFVGAAGWLGLQTRTVAARLAFPSEEPVCVAVVGGLWDAGGDLLRDPFQQILRRRLPRAEVIAPWTTPVYGAAQRAVALTNNCAAPYTEGRILPP